MTETELQHLSSTVERGLPLTAAEGRSLLLRITDLKTMVENLRENIKTGDEAMALQAASLTETIRRQRDKINYLKEQDHGSFGWVLRCLNSLNDGRWVFRRKGWNGKGMFIALQRPTDLSKMTLPYIFMHTAQGDYVPWLASQTDMLATDWEEAD